MLEETVIKWLDRSELTPRRNFGWYLVVLKPNNFEECEADGLDYSDWISSYGFDKAWYNNCRFWVADPHGYGTKEVTNRVIMFAELPKVSI